MQRLLPALSRAFPKSPRALSVQLPKTQLSPRLFTTTTKMGSTSTIPATAPAPGNADTFLSLIKTRRSYYPLNKTLPISTDRIQTIVSEAIQHVPSSFNSQSNRAVVLLGAEHDKFWDITTEILKAIVPADAWEATGKKMAMFKAGGGTVLFFEDRAVVEGLQAKFATYADRFPVWAGHTSAMLQFAIWTALESEGLGANLQHYNPLVDARVAEEWKLPVTWKLTAQLVFGGKDVAEAGPKTFLPLEDKLKVFGA